MSAGPTLSFWCFSPGVVMTALQRAEVGQCTFTLSNPRSKRPEAGTKHLKVKHEKLLSGSAFNFNLRRYTEVRSIVLTSGTLSPMSSFAHGRVVQVDPIKPTLKPHKIKRL